MTPKETVMPGHNDNRKGTPAIFGLTLVLASLILSLQAAAAPSTSVSDGVSLQLWAGSDNWTKAGDNESFILVVGNANSTLSLKEVNVTLSKISGSAVFGLSEQQASGWACYNFDLGSAGNVTHMVCNTTASNITDGSSLNITFYARAMPLSTEASYEWNVTVLNETNSVTVSQNITSGIDGLAPRFSGYSDNGTILSGNDSVYVSVNVTDLNLNTSSVSMKIASVGSNATVGYTPAVNNVLYPASIWNYSASVPLSGFSDGNYTLNVTAYDTVSNYNQTIPTSLWFFYDAQAPTVTLNEPAEAGWDADGNVTFNFTPYDTSLSIANCSLWIGNSTGNLWTLNTTNNTVSNGLKNNITVYGLSEGSYTWNVECTDSKSQSAFDPVNQTINVGSSPNIIVSAINVPNKPVSPYPNQQNLNFTVTFTNNGTGNTENGTFMKVCFGTGSDPCSSGNLATNTTQYVDAADLTAGASKNITYFVNMSSSHGTYYVSAEADYNGSETEAYEGDNTLTYSFSTLLNVTVYNILNLAGSMPRPGQNVSVFVNVTFPNGTFVDNISIYNFSVYDAWLGYTLTRNESAALNSSHLALVSLYSNGSGYTFNYTVPSLSTYNSWDNEKGYQRRYAEYGSHALSIRASDNRAGRGYYGDSDEPSTLINYTILAPNLLVEIQSYNRIDNLDVGDEETEDVTYSNNGNDNVTASLTVHEADKDGDTGAIDIDDNLTSDITINGLAIDGEYIVYDVLFTAEEAGTVNVTFNFTTLHGGLNYWYTAVYKIVVEAAEEDDEQTPTTTTNTQTQSYECTSNTTCASDKWCKNLACVALTCPAGYTATDHTCKIKSVYDISVSASTDKVAVIQGGNATVRISVKNGGNTDLTVTLSTETGVPEVLANASPSSQLIKAGETKNFTVAFSASTDAPIGKYTGSFKATTSFTAAKGSKEFILTVNPLPAAIAKLETSYENYTAIYDQLIADFSAAKGQLSGDNLTMLETKINETTTIFASLKKAMEDEDYAQAAVYLSQLDVLIDSARSTMAQFGIEEGVGSIWNTLAVWLIVALVCVGAAGLLLYMIMPSRGYMHGKGYSPHGGKSAMGHKLRDALSSIGNAVPKGGGGGSRPSTAEEIVRQYKLHYDGTYKKLDSAYKPAEPGMSDKMKNIFKKK